MLSLLVSNPCETSSGVLCAIEWIYLRMKAMKKRRKIKENIYTIKKKHVMEL